MYTKQNTSNIKSDYSLSLLTLILDGAASDFATPLGVSISNFANLTAGTGANGS